MLSRFRVATTLARKLEELGVLPADVLRQAGLPTGLFDQEKIFLSTEELFALYRGIGQASRDPAIGLKLGSEPRVERYDPIAMAAVSARSFRDALQRLARYKQLVCPEELHVAERQDECRVQFRWVLAQEAEPPLLVDVCFARVVEIARQGTGAPINPKRLELRAASANRETYAALFGCPIQFDARQNTIVFDKADLDRPFLTHNADLYAMLSPQLEAELKQAVASKAIGEQVKGVLEADAGRAAAGDRGRRTRAGPQRTDAAAEAGRGGRDIPASDAGGAPRAGPPLLAAFVAGAQRNRLPPGVRGRPFLLPGVPRLGGQLARPVARASRRIAALDEGRGRGMSV
jgi:hypothetical protein